MQCTEGRAGRPGGAADYSYRAVFDGNDDAGSIGCNLTEHPGMNVFRDVLTGLLRRSDVQAVYAQIAELDAGEDCWPKHGAQALFVWWD